MCYPHNGVIGIWYMYISCFVNENLDLFICRCPNFVAHADAAVLFSYTDIQYMYRVTESNFAYWFVCKALTHTHTYSK